MTESHSEDLESPEFAATEDAWARECHARMQAFERGEMGSIDGETFMTQLKAQLGIGHDD